MSRRARRLPRGALPLAALLAACGPPPGPEEPTEPVTVAAGSVAPAASPAEPEVTTATAPASEGPSVRCPDALTAGTTGWTCAMHPRVREDHAGTCPICGMDLVEHDAADAMTDAVPPDVDGVPDYAYVGPRGLASCVVRAGTGTRHPTERDRVTVHYVGWTTDGTSFDSSLRRGTPATFPLDRVIEGWTRGVPLMVEGEVRRLWIPAEMAYGDGGAGRPAGMLVFDVELLSIGGS